MKRLPETLFFQFSDSDIVEFRRCGDFPDLFASDRGEIIRVEPVSIFSVSNSPCVKYRGSNISARALVADAWISHWEREGRQLETIDGDRMNLSVMNLRPTSGHRGRPPGGKLRFLAMVFQTFLKTMSVHKAAEELHLQDSDVRTAIAIFDPDMIHLAE